MKSLLKLSFFVGLAAIALTLAGNSSVFAAGTAGTIGNNGSSFNWAGYVATNASYTGVTGTWTVPAVSAQGNLSADAAWVGIGGVTSGDLIQAGTQAIANLNGSGQVAYQAWFEMLPRSSRTVALTVNAGDSVTANINQTAPGQWNISLRDNTTGQTFQRSVAYNSSLSSAEWIEEMPASGNSLIPLDNFGTIQFTNASTIKNGQSETAAQANAQPLNMVSASGQQLASASGLNSDGASFAVARSANQATATPQFQAAPGFGSAPGTGFGSTPGTTIRIFRIGTGGAGSIGISGFRPRRVSRFSGFSVYNFGTGKTFGF